jgi:hypothetical protein
MTIYFGGQGIVFPDCRLGDVRVEVSDSGEWVVSLVVFDRRWKWKFGWVRGRYNVRQTKEPLVLRNEKKPKELLEILLKEMGEKKWKFVDVPNDTRPFVDWDEPATAALQRLIEELNCRVWLDPMTNLVTIGKSNVGMQLPVNLLVMSDTLTLHAPDCPDTIRFLAGPTLWQDDLPLEAVAECPDTNSVKPLEEVKYIKAAGGAKHLHPPFFGNLPEKYRPTAQKCVWRWYRIKEPIEVNVGDKWQFTINNRWQILPLQKTALELEKHATPVTVQYPWEKEEMRKPAIVIGKFDGEKGIGEEERHFTESRWAAGGKFAKWQHGFTLDADRGIVQLGGICRLPDEKTGQMGPAKIYLRVGFGVRDETTEAWMRWYQDYTPKMKKMGVTRHVIARQDIQRMTFVQWPDFGWPQKKELVSNEDYVKEQASFYIDQELQRFLLETPGQRKYAGLFFYPLDGAIQQVTWDIALDGRCTTILSRNREDPERSLTYKELRERTLIDALVKRETEEKTRNKEDNAK